jgi:hypothetical protein
MALAGPDVADFSDATHTIFSSLGAFTFASPSWLIDGGGATEINVGFIQASVFNDLGIPPFWGALYGLTIKLPATRRPIPFGSANTFGKPGTVAVHR